MPSKNTEAEQNPNELNFEALADLMMQRMNLQVGEKVLLVGTPGQFDPLITALNDRITNSPGEYLGAVSIEETQPTEWSTPFISEMTDLKDDELKDYLKQVDIGIMLPGATPEDKIYGLMQQNLDEGISRTIHFHWAGAYDFNGELLDATPEIDQFYQRVLLETDYGKLAKDQQRFEEAMRDQAVNVTTPAGTDISFEIGDRPVTKQSGDASAATAESARNLIDREMELPSGAIRVAPIETSVNGKIAFPDALWADSLVQNLVLTFEQGKVVGMTANSGIEAVQKVMEEAGEAAKSFREFALGMNPRLAIPETDPWIPYYGYGSGVVRLSLGDNTELGGNVTGGFVRWNFFTDATVTVGEDVWVENGKLLK
ncbi:MAG: aminopeptidase [Cyclobacteriaceae bacterium]